jgi:preprotein translocase subunit SecE
MIKLSLMLRFLVEVKNELYKVTWPSRNDTIKLTAIVIGISIGVGIYLGALDLMFTELLKLLIG